MAFRIAPSARHRLRPLPETRTILGPIRVSISGPRIDQELDPFLGDFPANPAEREAGGILGCPSGGGLDPTEVVRDARRGRRRLTGREPAEVVARPEAIPESGTPADEGDLAPGRRPDR